MISILIIDDEVSMLRGIEFHLQESTNYRIYTASDRKTAIDLLNTHEFDLVVSDLMLPEIVDGLAIIQAAKTQWYLPSVLAMTAFDSVENAVNAMKAGADDFISKGFGLDEMSLRIDNMLEKKKHVDRLSIENRILRETIQKQFSDYQIVGKSSKIISLMKKVQKVAADAKVTCLIEGESGTGKELVASAIHDLSTRKNGTFVAVNTGGIPKDLIASELFGHLKGSFTGAISDKKGKFEEAHKGSLFLDEISTMDVPVQISLLRVLETSLIERVGSIKPIKVDVRIICASNDDLQKLIEKQKFREDLYYRLNVFNIELPPLRKRKQDIPYLIKYFRTLFNLELNKAIKEITAPALQVLKEYSWPGNVRELRNVLLRAVLAAEDVLDVNHLPTELTKNKLGSEIISFRAGTPLSEVERTMILQTLNAVNGNKLKAAEILGITRRSLYNKLEDYNIKDKNL